MCREALKSCFTAAELGGVELAFIDAFVCAGKWKITC